jgi:hypothetical protein
LITNKALYYVWRGFMDSFHQAGEVSTFANPTLQSHSQHLVGLQLESNLPNFSPHVWTMKMKKSFLLVASCTECQVMSHLPRLGISGLQQDRVDVYVQDSSWDRPEREALWCSAQAGAEVLQHLRILDIGSW